MRKILIRAPVLSQSGYGLQARTLLNALRKYPDRFDLYLHATPWGQCGWIWQDNEERRYVDYLIQKTIHYQQQGGQFDISIQVTIPSEFQPLAAQNILYTAGIESTKISPKWFEGCLKFNKIITTSNHAKFGIETTAYQVRNQNGQEFVAHVDTPIETIGYPVRILEPKPIELDLVHDFNFLVVAQWSPRKNLENTIKYFLEEFWDKKVGLVLKVQSVSNCKMDREHTTQRLKQLVDQFSVGKKDRTCSIQLLHGDLSDEEMTYVYQHPKIKSLISLANGEGFGLPMFEAIYNGLPVIAPSWGGQTDFISMPLKDKNKNKIKETIMISNVSYDIKNVQPEAVFPDMIIPESQWAFPHEWKAKEKMRDMHRNYGFHKSRALKLKDYICEKFEANKINRMFADAIAEDYSVLNIAEYLNDNQVSNPLLEDVVTYD